ncbi:hypothetical protein JOF29_003480 [Kribbella aluminosa]|uniref:Uncharacterized protein n=1 Tax=Kribbella aluminosa TaxID=416017 RepID=A0ABS4UL91_9ACTN|nr:hypothetical protein [Kribbella aluminosa]MBP2352397.1 hypothetical protein [Kribbella aluminosa]
MTVEQEQQVNQRPWWRVWQGRSATGGSTSPGSKVSNVYAVEATAIVGGLLATIAYAAAGSNASLSVVSAALMIAVAALGSGVLVGILFGVPRTTAGNDRPAGGDAAVPATAAVGALSAVGANTNLEQISDWLTKILVGVGLTQFAAIKREAAQLFHSLAPALGNGNGRASFAGSVVIYFFVVGFLTGWLYARLRLGLLMSNTDALLELARRADRAGDTETAQTARERANSQLSLATDASPTTPAGTTDLIIQYNRLRDTPPSARRTTQMSEVVRQAQRLLATRPYTPLDVTQLFNEGTRGSRIVALAMMEADPSLADFPSVLDAIQNSRSAFEQYHALTVASLMSAALAQDDKSRLRQALESDEVRSKWEGDTSRATLAATILATLKPPTG